MSKKYEQNAVFLVKCMHHSTNLPITLLHDGSRVFCQPENIESCASILHRKDLAPSNQSDETAVQYFENDLGETSLTYNLKNGYYILVGPMIKEHVSSGTLTNFVRKGNIPFHKKTALQKYYSKCTVADEEKIFYIEKLIELMFNSNDMPNLTEDDNKNAANESVDFFRQKKEYRQDSFLHTPYAIEQNISRTISSGDTEKAKRILVEMNIRPHAKLASTKLRSYKNSMICSCAFMTRAAISGGVSPDDAFTLSDIYINKIENSNGMKDLQNFESNMIEGFTEKVRELKEHSYSPTVLNTIYYIDNHLCEDIKIKQLAREVYVNPCYLSALFHKETGITISEWIQRKRIEEASHLVLNGNEDFSEIATFYHFCSQSYFVKCFKKFMGVTPGEYRSKRCKEAV
mgnify:CR=1 FL=1